ncbi:MAG: hypothetical protein ACFNKJ_08185, partial [Rothia dentocariosa]
ELSETMRLFAFDILGLVNERGANNDAREAAYGKVVDMVLDLRVEMRRFAELLGDRAYHEAVVAAKAEAPVGAAEAEAS